MRLARLFRLDTLRPDVSRDVAAEIDLYLDLRTQEFVEAGLAPAEARRAALRAFGDVEAVAAQCRSLTERRVRQRTRAENMRSLLQDVTFAARTLRRAPAFTAVAVLTLALGIGATTAIFGVVEAVLLRPLPYVRPEGLVAVSDVQEEIGETPASYHEYANWRRATHVFAELGSYYYVAAPLTGRGDPEMLDGVAVSDNLPRLLGVTPAAGRFFTPEETTPDGDRVAVLSNALWRRRFAADPRAVGQRVTLGGEPYTVVGVLPPGRRAAVPSQLASAQAADYWVPLRLDETRAPRGLHFITVVGRLRAGNGVAAAERQMQAFAAQLRRSDPRAHGARVVALSDRVVGGARRTLALVAGGVAVVLLVACANVANLLLVRGAARWREVAVRAALGAGRGRIVRQLLVESLVLAGAGAALGVGLAHAALRALRTLPALASAHVPRLDETALDTRVLAFAAALTVVTALVFGVVPALQSSRAELATALREGGRSATGGAARERLRTALVIGEVALSFVLLVGAGLLVRSFDRLLAVDKGFDAERVLSVQLSLPTSEYPGATAQVEFFRQVLDRLRSLPGVQGVAAVNNLPVEGGTSGGLAIEGRPFPTGESPVAEKRIATEEYFRVLRTRVIAGRAFDERDAAGTPPVMVVNESFARRFFPSQDPIGRRVEFSWGIEGAQTIVGVVADVKEQALDQPNTPAMYVAFAQRPEPSMYLLIRTAADPAGIAAAVRREVRAVDANLPLSQIRMLEEVVGQGLGERRVATTLFGAFSAAALLLAAIGLYGVISYSVLQRTQELGVRMALGATSGQVLRLVLRRSLAVVLVGLGLGAAGALALRRLMAGFVFGIGTADPGTYAVVSLVLLGSAALACYIPARRATAIHPIVALRSD